MCSTNVIGHIGRNLAERHRNLNHLIARASDETLSSERLFDLHDKPYLELVFIAKIADCKRNPRVICELLKSEQAIIVHTALHAKWLFKGTTHLEYSNAAYFEKEVFPYVSYHACCRIVATFGANLQNKQTAEEFYKLVKSLYGWKMAIKLLPACSTDYIKSQLKTIPLEIPCGPLFKIYQKDRQSVVAYLNKYYERIFVKKSKCFKFVNYDKIIKKLAWNEPNTFVSLIRNYPFSTRTKELISKRATKHLLKNQLNRVIECSKHLQYTINNKTVVKTLKNESLEHYLFNSFPNDYNEFPFTLTLHYLKDKQKALILFKLHPMKYNGISILERDILTPHEIKHIPVEERIKWVEEKLVTLNDDEQRPFYKYLEPMIATSRLKSKEKTREHDFELMREMSECYVINNNEKGLIVTIRAVTNVIRFIKYPHHFTQGILFLHRVGKLYNVKTVSVVLWSFIRQLVDTLSRSEDISPDQRVSLIHYFCDDLRFHIQHNLNYDSIISTLLELYSLNEIQSFVIDVMMTITVSEEKAILVKNLTMKIQNKLLTGSDDQKSWQTTLFILQLYNEAKKSVGISFTECEWLVSVIKKGVDFWSKDETNIIMTEVNKDRRGRMLFSKEIFLHSLDISILYWLLQHDTETILNNLDKFLSYFTDDSIPLNSKDCSTLLLNYGLSSYVHYDLCSWSDVVFTKDSWNRVGSVKSFSQRIKFFSKVTIYFFNTLRLTLFKNITDKIRVKSKPKNRALQIIICTRLFSSDDCKTFLEPNKKKPCMTDFLETIRNYIKHVNPPLSKDMLMKYIENGYSPLFESGVMAIGSKKSIKNIKEFIEDLMKESGPFKKLGLNLAFNVLPINDLINFFVKIWNETLNTQVKRIIYTKTIKLLQNEDREQKSFEIWNHLKYFIACFTDIDITLFYSYVKLSDKMASKPVIIFNEYCGLAWKKLRELPADDKDVKFHKNLLTKCVMQNVNFLGEAWLEILVVDYWNYVEMVETANVPEVLPFLIAYLMQNSKAQDTKCTHRSVYICNKFKKCAKYLWTHLQNDVYVFREYLTDFVKAFCKHSIQMKTDKSLLTFLAYFTKMVLPSLTIGEDNTVCFIHMIIFLSQNFVMLRNDYDPKNERQEQIIINGYSDKMNKTFGKNVLEFYNVFKVRYGDLQDVFFDNLKYWISFLIEDESDNVGQDITMSVLDGLDLAAFPKISGVNLRKLLPESLYVGSKYTNLYDNLLSLIFNMEDGTTQVQDDSNDEM